MVFNSYIFILLFLPLTVMGYFFINKVCTVKYEQAGLLWLFFMSLWFYGYDTPGFIPLLLGSILVNYLIGNKILHLKQKEGQNLKLQKFFLTAGIIVNLAPLLYLKYSNFFLDMINTLKQTDWHLDLELPLGISFFTFMQIAYLADCYRQEKRADYTLLEYGTFVAFFPKMTMGPIAFASEVIPQFREKEKKKISYRNLSCGLYLFTLGLAKKVLIADILAKFVNAGYKNVADLNSTTALLVMLSYTLQLYFDFSGYCDMAMGVAGMLNIELPINFNSPYKAKSISEFWDRWHMTLTRFFTRYVYIPLGGSRKGRFRTYLNTMIVFLLSGLWHGANWTFVFWGALHGTFMILERIGRELGIGVQKKAGAVGKVTETVKWFFTFLLLNITWVFFRADSLDGALLFLRRIFNGGFGCQEFIIEIFDKLIEIRFLKRIGLSGIFNNYTDLIIWLILFLIVSAVVFSKNALEKMKTEKYTLLRSISTVILLVWCVISLSDVSEFLYFNF